MTNMRKWNYIVAVIIALLGGAVIAINAQYPIEFGAGDPGAGFWPTMLGGLLIVLAVVLVFTYQGFKYVGVAGKQISQGMEIPMMYMYGIMPVCGIICAICVVIKIITLYKADISYFAPKNQALSRDDA